MFNRPSISSHSPSTSSSSSHPTPVTSPNGNVAPSPSPSTGASSSPLKRIGSIPKQHCCVVDCQQGREKEGPCTCLCPCACLLYSLPPHSSYCMPHYMLFKQPFSNNKQSKSDEAARLKADEKAKKEMEAARRALEKENEKERLKKAADIKKAASSSSSSSSSSSVPSSPKSSSASSSSSAKSRWWKRGSATMGAPLSPKSPSRFGCFNSHDDMRTAIATSSSPSPSPSPESPLLLEVRQAWTTAHKVVFKDLPRLAKRITISTEEDGTLIEAGRIVKIRQTSKHDPQDSSLSVSSSSSSPPNKETMDEHKQMVDDIAAASSSSYPPLSDPAVNVTTTSSSASSSIPSEVDTWQAVCNVLLCTLEQLESPEIVSSARSALEKAASEMHQGSDHQSVLENIFTSIITLQSRTYKIFQSIHQSILFPAIAHLHEKLYAHPAVGNLKDCRRADGWTVQIHIGSAIYITHQRWEQSLHPEHDPRHFEVLWNMRLSFDKQLQQLRAVILRIQELVFHSDAPQDHRNAIKEVLMGSGYIV